TLGVPARIVRDEPDAEARERPKVFGLQNINSGLYFAVARRRDSVTALELGIAGQRADFRGRVFFVLGADRGSDNGCDLRPQRDDLPLSCGMDRIGQNEDVSSGVAVNPNRISRDIPVAG